MGCRLWQRNAWPGHDWPGLPLTQMTRRDATPSKAAVLLGDWQKSCQQEQRAVGLGLQLCVHSLECWRHPKTDDPYLISLYVAHCYSPTFHCQLGSSAALAFGPRPGDYAGVATAQDPQGPSAVAAQLAAHHHVVRQLSERCAVPHGHQSTAEQSQAVVAAH